MFKINEIKNKCKLRFRQGVVYGSLDYRIPKWVNYVATNSSGKVYGYENKPIIATDGRAQWTRNSDCKKFYIGRVEFSGDWKESLLEM